DKSGTHPRELGRAGRPSGSGPRAGHDAPRDLRCADPDAQREVGRARGPHRGTGV
ncbi:MAG: hypothetical protein AVDCRST_MAG60-2480, partial [uncultured Nocardioides sp.]